MADLDFVPRITDFGLAQFMDTEVGFDSGTRENKNSVSFATRTGAVIGTPRYMAPEQIEGERAAIGPATDVYGLGAILYETLTGTAPFSAPGKLELMRQVLMEIPTPPRHVRPDTPSDLEAICLKCLEKRPDRRYASAADLAADLNRFLHGESTHARPLTNIQRTVRWVWKHPVVAGWSMAVVWS